METKELLTKPLAELRQIAEKLDVNRANRLKREALVLEIQRADAELNGREVRGGVLEIMSEGIGFLRSANYVSGPDDIYVSQSQIRRFDLRSGDLVIGHVRPPRNSERHYGLLKADSVDAIAWIVLVCLAGVLAIGLSWAHIWRRLTGQYSVDDTDD